MSKHNLPSMTQAEREEMLIKAAEVKAAKKAWAEDNLKQDWADKSHWQELASKYSVRLPVWYIPATETKYLKRLFRQLEMEINEYVDAMGCSNIKELVSGNTTMPAWVAVGLALEWIDEVKSA